MEPTSGNSAYGEFKPSSYQAPVEDIVAKYEKTTKGDNNPDDVYQHNLKLINRNRLDRNT